MVLGPIADEVAREIQAALSGITMAPVAAAAAGTIQVSALLAALGGRANLARVEAAANRLLVELADPGKLDGPALIRAGARGVAAAGANRRQVLLGGDASAVAARMAEFSRRLDQRRRAVDGIGGRAQHRPRVRARSQRRPRGVQ